MVRASDAERGLRQASTSSTVGSERTDPAGDPRGRRGPSLAVVGGVWESAGSLLELTARCGCVLALGSRAGRHEYGREEAARAEAVRLVGKARLLDHGAQVGDERG